MTIIVLNGKANSGKSTVIRRLVNYLLEKEGKFICKKDADRFENGYNFTVPFIYKDVLIAITSLGDDCNTIKNTFNNYVNYAPIMICAAHPSKPFQKQFEELKVVGHTIVNVSISHTDEVYEPALENKYTDCVNALFGEISKSIIMIKGEN